MVVPHNLRKLLEMLTMASDPEAEKSLLVQVMEESPQLFEQFSQIVETRQQHFVDIKKQKSEEASAPKSRLQFSEDEQQSTARIPGYEGPSKVSGVENTEVVTPFVDSFQKEPEFGEAPPRTEVVSPRTEVVSPKTEVVSPQTEVVSPQTEVVSPQTEVMASEATGVASNEELDLKLHDLNQQGMQLYQEGRFEDALYSFQQALDIAGEIFGPSHLDYATSLNNLAVVYYAMQDYEQAEPLYLQAKDIEKIALGPDHPDYAQSLSNLAGLYQCMGRFEDAESLHLEAKNIMEGALGKNHPDYQQIVGHVKEFYTAIGKQAKADQLS